MKKTVLASVIIFSFLLSSAQKEANIWYFGSRAGVNFNSGAPVALSNSVMSTNEGCASIADKNTGLLLFYTDGSTIWNKNHTQMTNGTGLTGNYSSTQSAVIVPMPGSSSLYYVFTVDAQAGFYTSYTGNLSYTIVDMSLSGGLGSVTTKNQVLRSYMTEKIAAVRACNGKDIWVIGHEWNTSAFYAWRLTTTGVSAPVVTSIGVIHRDVGSANNAETIGYMKCSPDGKKLAVSIYERLNTVQIFDFDNATGIVSNPATDTNFPNASGYDGPYGATFSPDNTKLYVSIYGFSPTTSKVYQYNMQAGSAAAIIASRTLIASTSTGYYGAMQIGPNGKVYVAKGTTAYLDAINNPNDLGAACNYQSNAVMLASTTTASFGLPVIVESFLIAPYTASLSYTDCNGTHTVDFIDTTINGTITCTWDFGDPASGSANTSNLQNASHSFTSSGNYSVKVYISNACTTDTISKTLNVSLGTAVAAATPRDTAFCEGNYVQLNASGGTTYSWLPTAGLSDATIANPVAYPFVSTTYTVTVHPPPCGDSTATVKITVFPSPSTPNITPSHDTLYCSTDTSYRTYQWYYNSTLIAGATKTYYVYSGSGNYNVAVTNVYGCVISVGINIIGVVEYSLENLVSIWPNPANKELHIKTSGLNIERAELFNVLGEMIYISEPKNGNRKSDISIHISTLSQGIYFLRLNTESGVVVKKFVKE